MSDHQQPDPEPGLDELEQRTDMLVNAIRRKDQAFVRGEDPRVADWVRKREAALWHLTRANAIARGRLGSGDADWARVHEILTGLVTNYRLDLLNVCLDRDVTHLPPEWIEVDFTTSDEYEAAQMYVPPED